MYFAKVHDSFSQIVGSNRVVYPDAFDGVNASVSYTYTRAGISQDIRFHARPPSPESFGLNPATTHLLAFTEVTESPAPQIQERSWPAGTETMNDQTIGLGPMRMIPGRAFRASNARRTAGFPVAKKWETIDGRTFIVERLQWSHVKADLLQLPDVQTNSVSAATNASIIRNDKWYALKELPPTPKKNDRPSEMVGRGVPTAPGATRPVSGAVGTPRPTIASAFASTDFVLDWELVNGDGSSWSFSCDTTWLIDGYCYLSDAYFWAQAVVKFTPGSAIEVVNAFYWDGNGGCGDGPAIFTEVNDDTYGQHIPYGGSPNPGDYGPALILDDCSYLQVAMDNLDIHYASSGVVPASPCISTVTITPTKPMAIKGVTPEYAGIFTVTRTDGDWNQDLPVQIDYTGTAVAGSGGSGDYDITGSATILAGNASAAITVHPHAPIGDTFEKTVIATIQSDSSYTIGNPGAATVCIEDPSAPVPSPVTAPAGLVSWWRGENDATDSSGANPGSLLNGLGFQSAYVGRGLEFDGVDDRFTANSSASLNFGNNADYSIEAWIRVTPAVTAYGVQSIVDKRNTPSDSSATGYTLHLVNGQLGCQISPGGAIYNFGPTGPDLRDGHFHHVAVTVDRDSTTGGHLYVDGVSILTFNAALAQGDLSNTELFRVGNHASSWLNAYFKGVIDEVAIYNRALSGSEIQSIYTAGRGGKCGAGILTQPQSQSVSEGDNANFSVVATGATPISYCWKKNGVVLNDNTHISGAATATLSISSVTPGDAGVYIVEVTGAVCTRVSSPAGLTVCHDAATTYHDQVLPGQLFVFSQNSISDVVFNFPDNRLIVGYQIDVSVREQFTSLDSPPRIQIEIGAPPNRCEVYTSDPPDANSKISDLALLGGPYDSPSYWTLINQWNLPLLLQPALSWYDYHIEQSMLGADNFGSQIYTFRIHGFDGPITYPGGAGVISPIERVFATEHSCDSPPAIVRQPQDQPVCLGSPSTFTVLASGSNPLSYQWRFNGANIPGATASSYNINTVGSQNLGRYSVVVANWYGSLESDAATLSLATTPTVSILPVADAQESCTEGAFEVLRTCISGPLTIYYTIAGTAANGTDYNTLAGTVLIPDGQASALIRVVPIPRTLGSDKTVILTLDSHLGYTVGTPNSATIYLRDEAPTIRPGFDTTQMWRNDDESTDKVPIGFSVQFGYSTPFTDLYINNNGNVTFEEELGDFTPYRLTDMKNIMAPFWADVDTFNELSGVVAYGTGTVEGHNAFGVTWPNVGYFDSQADKRNTFQLILIDHSDIRSGDFDIEFNYEKIRWETGSYWTSGGTFGFGGYSARAGFSIGPERYELPGSGVNGALLDSNGETGLKYHSLGTCQPGRYVFHFRNGALDRLPAVELSPFYAATLPATVSLSAPNHPNAFIYYTLDGSTPTRASTLYTVPITVSANTQIKAFATEPGLADGPVSSGVYGNAAPTPDGCVAWWSAENSLEDHTGRHNGVCLVPQVANPAIVPGKVGYAFSIDPIPANNKPPVLVLDDEFLAQKSSLSVEGWIKVLDSSADGIIFDRQSAYTVISKSISGDSSHSSLTFEIAGGSDSVQATIPVGQWTHFAATFQQTIFPVSPNDPSFVLSLYINGGLVAQKTMFAQPWGDLNGGFACIGGSSTSLGNTVFNGLIDELAVYCRAISEAEINWIYLAGVNGKLPIQPSAPRAGSSLWILGQ